MDEVGLLEVNDVCIECVNCYMFRNVMIMFVLINWVKLNKKCKF